MSYPNDEMVEFEESPEGDVPDDLALDRRELEANAAEPDEAPLIGSIDDLENGSEVGWSE